MTFPLILDQKVAERRPDLVEEQRTTTEQTGESFVDRYDRLHKARHGHSGEDGKDRMAVLRCLLWSEGGKG